MNKLSECIDYYNHFTTISLKDSHILRYKDTPLEEPNIDSSISLYEFVYSFGIMYNSFKRDFDNIPKFNLGESFEVWDYSDFDNEKEITLYINNPNIIDNDFCYLNLVENNGIIKSYVSTNDHEYYLKNNEIKLDDNFTKKYYEFVKKYYHFIECFNISKGNIMFSNPHCLIINDYVGDIYNGLESMILKFDMDYHEKNYIASIIFDLNTLSVDYEKSMIEGIKGNKEEAINKFLTEIYVDKSRIASSYTDTEEDKTLRLKKGLDI